MLGIGIWVSGVKGIIRGWQMYILLRVLYIAIAAIDVELVVVGIGIGLKMASMRIGVGVAGSEVVLLVEVPHV